MATTDEIRTVVEPVLTRWGLDIYDLELAGRTLRVTVEGEDGVDLDMLSEVTRAVSGALDEHDPVPGGKYTLEVSSPGLERALRRPEHFRGAVGERITVKTVPEAEGERRVEGLLAAADDDGITVDLADGVERRLAYHDIARARTVFEWGPSDPPGKGQRSRKRASTS